MITTYTPSPNLIAMLEKHEGVRPKLYHDTLGIPSAGVGRNLLNPGLSREEIIFLLERVELPQDLIILMLKNDIERTAHQAAGAIGDDVWPTLSEARQSAIIDLAFSGIKSLEKFVKMIAAIRSGDWETAAKECLDSTWATQVGPHRANDVANLLRTGEWNSGPSGTNQEGGNQSAP